MYYYKKTTINYLKNKTRKLQHIINRNIKSIEFNSVTPYIC
jgi:hypothetical protein